MAAVAKLLRWIRHCDTDATWCTNRSVQTGTDTYELNDVVLIAYAHRLIDMHTVNEYGTNEQPCRYGSWATGLSLPGSDIDLSLMIKSKGGGQPAERRQAGHTLCLLDMLPLAMCIDARTCMSPGVACDRFFRQ